MNFSKYYFLKFEIVKQRVFCSLMSNKFFPIQRNRILFLITPIFLDQLIKWIFIVSNNTSVTINQGFFFGFFQHLSDIITFLHIYFIILLFFLYKKYRFDHKLEKTILLIMSGSFSNLIDRCIHNGIVDYIHLSPLPSFNLSDLIIVISVLYLLMYCIPKVRDKHTY